MAKRDPLKTARNKKVASMQNDLRAMLPDVLAETGYEDEASVNAKIGHKTDYFIDLKNVVITSPDHYVELWMEGFKAHRSRTGFGTVFDDFYDEIQASPAFQEYLDTFLRRSYLKHYDELYKRRPQVHEAEVWIGENHAHYGLLVTPDFRKGDWANDKSEIRHFKPRYWTIGHVLETGLVIPGEDEKITFKSVDEYLIFFQHVLVRQTASIHQKRIAARYKKFVGNAVEPEKVPLLIPEFRYNGRDAKHQYRLDFCVIDADTMDKVGFELSPWSSHGQLTATRGKTQKAINAEASANFDREMKKHKDFFKKHGVYALIYTDADLKDPDAIFADIEACLKPQQPAKQLSFHYIKDFFKPAKGAKPKKPALSW